MGKKWRRSLFLCVLCILIAMPYNVFANTTGTDETSASTVTTESSADNSAPPSDASAANDTGTVTAEPAPAADQTTSSPEQTVTPAPDQQQGVTTQAPTVDTTSPTNDNNAAAPAPAAPASTTDQASATVDAAANVQADAVYLGQSDNHEPKIATVTFSQQDVHVGDTVKVTVKHDFGSTTNYSVLDVSARIWDPAKDLNDSQTITLRYDSDHDEWFGYFVVQESWNPGYWRAEITAHYNFTCEHGVTYSDYEVDKRIPYAFNVVNNGDSTPPEVVSVTADPTPVKAGQEVTFTATIKDVNNQSSVVYADLLIYQNGTELYFDAEHYVVLTHVSGDIWQGKYVIPANLPDDSRIEYSILAYDQEGNAVLKDSGSKTRKNFRVSNKLGDVIKLVSPDWYSNYSVSKGDPATVKVKVKAKDIGEGINAKSLQAVLYSYQTGQYYHFTDLTNVPDTNAWKGDIKLTYMDRGGWYAVYVTGEYSNGSKINYQYMTEIYLQNDDYVNVSIDKININPKRPASGDTINISAAVNFQDYVPMFEAAALADAKPDKQIASVSAAVVYPSYRNEEDYFDLSFDPATGKWTRPYTLKVYDPQGFDVLIKAVDKAGNVYFGSETFNYDKSIIDQTAPNFDYVKFSTATIKLGQTYHVETKVFDASGVQSVRATLTNRTSINYYNNYYNDKALVSSLSVMSPSDITNVDYYGNWNPFFDEKYASLSFDLHYNAAKGVWEGDYTLPLDGPTGLFVVNLIAQDTVGNQQSTVFNQVYYSSLPQTLVILPADKTVPVDSKPAAVAPLVAEPVAVTTTVSSLPNTATNSYNLLFAGLVLIAAGGTILVIRRRKTN